MATINKSKPNSSGASGGQQLMSSQTYSYLVLGVKILFVLLILLLLPKFVVTATVADSSSGSSSSDSSSSSVEFSSSSSSAAWWDGSGDGYDVVFGRDTDGRVAEAVTAAANRRSRFSSSRNRAAANRHGGKRIQQELHKTRVRCEREVCTEEHYVLDESMNCVFACVSPSCFGIVYGDEPLEDGEIDIPRAMQFEDCALEEIRSSRQRQREEAIQEIKSFS